MRIILIDDHGEIRELTDDGNLVMEAAKQDYFSPCGICGHVAFDDEYNQEIGGCKGCAAE